jgi:hypothetical protein
MINEKLLFYSDFFVVSRWNGCKRTFPPRKPIAHTIPYLPLKQQREPGKIKASQKKQNTTQRPARIAFTFYSAVG